MKLKNIFLTSVLTATAVICGGNQQASAVVLDFDNLGLNSFEPIPQTYGDTNNLDVSYRVVLQPGSNETTQENLLYWDFNYSGLEDVAFGAVGQTSELGLTPSQGYQVTLNSFDLGAWPNLDRNSPVRVYNGDLSQLLRDFGVITVPGEAPSTFLVNLTRQDGFRIQWGPDGYNVGIDNIDYEVAAVPEPLTILGSLAAIGVGVVLKREYDRKIRLAEVSS